VLHGLGRGLRQSQHSRREVFRKQGILALQIGTKKHPAATSWEGRLRIRSRRARSSVVLATHIDRQPISTGGAKDRRVFETEQAPQRRTDACGDSSVAASWEAERVAMGHGGVDVMGEMKAIQPAPLAFVFELSCFPLGHSS